MIHPETSGKASWVGAWYAAPTRMVSANVSGRTLRQIIHLHAGGTHLRLHVSNRYGDGPVTLSAFSVGRVLQGSMVAPGAQVVQFAGQSRITLEPGQDMVSDPVALQVEVFSDLAVTFFLAEGEILTGHMWAQQTSYVSGSGNMTTAPAEAALFVYPLQTTSWWLITGIDVLPFAPLNAVVVLGSSTTDGVGSTLNANRRWPDYLARRLQEAGGARFMSVINSGIGGNQLTSSEMPFAGGAGIPLFLFGEAGRTRLAWDGLVQAGATDLLLHIGSNDLRVGVAGTTLIEALQQVATQARQHYRRVFGTTILPGGYLPTQVEQRHLVNTWLREQRNQCFDALFDLAMPLASIDDEAVLRPEYDSGDGIHPNDEGYRRMAEAIDVTQLTGSPGREV